VSSRTIALTGATGFIGAELARALTTAGWQIRALVRSTSRLQRLDGIALHPLVGSLAEPERLRELVGGVHAVIHCAGVVRGATAADFYPVNVDGVVRLARIAAEQDPPPRFLSISSLAAREPHLSDYAASKRQGELGLAEAADSLDWFILRPPAVYGPGDKELLPLFRLMRRGVAPILGSRGARFSLLYVQDLADAVVRWLETGNGIRGTFELHDGRSGGYSWHDVIATAERLRGGRVLPVSVPSGVLRLLARLNLGLSRPLGYAPMLTPGKVGELMHPDWVCDNGGLCQAMGWTPRVGLEEGLRRTLAWRCTSEE